MTTHPQPVSRILESDEQFAKLLQRVRENRRNTERVRRLLPADLAGHLSAALFQEGRLVLLTHSPVWASRLRFAEPGLRASLNHTGAIRVKVLPSSGTAPPARHDRRGARTLSSRIAEQIRAIAATVSDAELSRALLHLATHGEENSTSLSGQDLYK